MDENGHAEAGLRRKLKEDPSDFDTLVRLIALTAKHEATVEEEEVEAWLEELRRTFDVTARQRYSLASLLFTMGRYQAAWEQCWAGMHSRPLDDQVRDDLRELIRILRDDMSGLS